MNAQIRKMLPCEYPEVAALIQSCLRGHILEKSSYEIWKENPNHTFWVAVQDDCIVGHMWIEKVVDIFLQESYFYLRNICVKEDCRRKGIASKLLEHCEHLAHNQGVDYITFTSSNNKKEAHILYEKLNYNKKDTTVFIKRI